jgi:hypothetical protein
VAELPDVDATVQRIEALVDAQPEAAELVQLLMRLYGAGLSRVVELVREPDGTDILERLAGDKLVASLLLLHGLHPVDAQTRLRKALQRLERRLESHRLVLAEVTGGVACIRVEHNGGGPLPQSVAEMIERAALEAAPDIEAVEIQGAAAPSGLVQIAPAKSASPVPPPRERCELCATVLPSEHSHVVDVENRRLMCSCRPCYLLFTNPAAANGKYRSVGERRERLAEAAFDFEAFDMPAGMAFFIRNSKLNRVSAYYPSPGGATESALAVDESWPALRRLEPDIEALLVYRRGGVAECWIVPVDACYELVGRIRRCWRGFDGGAEAWAEIASFFANLRQHRSVACPT